MASPYISPDLVGACTKVREWMSDNVGTNDPRYLRKGIGMLQSIQDPTNVGGFRFKELATNGKLKKVQITGYQRRLAEDATETLSCATPADRHPDYEEDISITKEVQSEGVTIAETEFREICMDDPSELAKLLADDQAAVRERLNNELLQLVKLNSVGINMANIVSGSPSSDVRSIDILDSVRANLPQGIGQFMVEYSDNLLQGAPFVVGQGNIQQFFHNLAMGCCNDAGFDMEKVQSFISQNQLAFWLDQHGNDLIGTNQAICYAPGALQLLHINRYKGFYTNRDPEQQRFVVADAQIPGLMWDVYATRTKCADGKGMNEFHFKHQLIWDLWQWPADAFQSSDELNGMTGVLLYEFSQAT